MRFAGMCEGWFAQEMVIKLPMGPIPMSICCGIRRFRRVTICYYDLRASTMPFIRAQYVFHVLHCVIQPYA